MADSPIRVIVCGSRTWTNEGPIREFIRSLPRGSTVVHGWAKGADSIAAQVAHARGDLHVVALKADWEKYGRSAGPRRNAEMLAMGADLVRAFRLAGDSPGTDDMIRRAKLAGIPVEVTHA